MHLEDTDLGGPKGLCVYSGHHRTMLINRHLQLSVHAGVLSPGELQRLAVARLLYHRPLLAVMDEPVSAVGTLAGLHLLQLLQQHGITALVTGQADGAQATSAVYAHLLTQTVCL